jgi:serine/threonine protein kinase
LEGQPHVVGLRDTFPLIQGSGAARSVKYVLVFDWMAEGTVYDALNEHIAPWPEQKTMRQITKLLEVLELLHQRGICHGDITPKNIFFKEERLLLGDLGIAKQKLGKGPLMMEGAAPEIFRPRDVPLLRWSPSEDVYQIGLLTLSLLTGQFISSDDATNKLLKQLKVSDATKGWIRDTLMKSGHRFQDAHEALTTLRGRGVPVKPASPPRTLRGQQIVFTGRLPMARPKAAALARKAGGIVQREVNGATTLVVAGQPNPLQIGQRYGKKLFDVQRRIRRGQRIAIINTRRFAALVGR